MLLPILIAICVLLYFICAVELVEIGRLYDRRSNLPPMKRGDEFAIGILWPLVVVLMVIFALKDSWHKEDE